VTNASGTIPAPPGGPQQQVMDRASLARDLRSLGVIPGQVLLVHASLRRIGRVSGGASDVVAALRQVLGPDATLVVPTSTAYNSDTSRLYLARTEGMTADEIRRYRDAMPPFTPERLSVGMGRIAECVPDGTRRGPEPASADLVRCVRPAGPDADDRSSARLPPRRIIPARKALPGERLGVADGRRLRSAHVFPSGRVPRPACRRHRLLARAPSHRREASLPMLSSRAGGLSPPKPSRLRPNAAPLLGKGGE
jgi:Aminoglycoside 3-N-acetyltransferase